MSRSAVLLLCVLHATFPLSQCLNNGVGRKPPMGWNSWFALGCSAAMNSTTVRTEADTMVSSGLHALGYEYVNLDDCMMEPGAGGRDPTTHRLQPANATFGGEAGLKALSAYIHSKGLKFGVPASSSRTHDGRHCRSTRIEAARPACTVLAHATLRRRHQH